MCYSIRTIVRAGMPKRATFSPQRNAFAKTRADHAMETAQDYVEAISDILHQRGECRVKDLTRVMGVSHVTVTRIIARLRDLDLVATERHRPIRLTTKGATMAAASRARHEIVFELLRALGVPAAEAQRDAEGIEHHVGEKTLEAMRKVASNRGGAK